MGKKDKQKKISAKKEKYAKFRKEKPGTVTLTMPELTAEEQREKQENEMRIMKFVRFNSYRPERFVNERKARSKR